MKPPRTEWVPYGTRSELLISGSKTLARIDHTARKDQWRVVMLLPPVTYDPVPYSRDEARQVAEIAVGRWFEDLVK